MKKINRFYLVAVLGGVLSLVNAQAATVGQRQENQQDRIAQGVASGKLSAGETARLEGREAGLNKEIRNDRAANGGHLTTQERAQVNRQQNRMSGAIYRAKHDGPRR